MAVPERLDGHLTSPPPEDNVVPFDGRRDAEWLPPLVPPGVYTAITTRGDVRTLFGRRTAVLVCELVEPVDVDGVKLAWYAALPDPGRRPAGASKFATAWCVVMGRRPHRGERPAIRDLVGKRLRIVVATVTVSWERDRAGHPARCAAHTLAARHRRTEGLARVTLGPVPRRRRQYCTLVRKLTRALPGSPTGSPRN